MPLADIQIADEFTNPIGEWFEYDAIPVAQRDQLRKQKHVDIRSFEPIPVFRRIPMLYIDLLTMNGINSLTMTQLEADIVARKAETWSGGTVEKQADLNNYGGLTVECTVAGPNVASSVITG